MKEELSFDKNRIIIRDKLEFVGQRRINMWFYIMMFICNLLIPIVMLICGFFMSKYPPKEINGIIGYRTTMSRKNMDTWKFAHDYCGKLWLKLGLLLLIPTIIIQIPFSHSSENAIGYMTLIVEGIQLVAILGSIVFVERALKKTFDEHGVRR